MKEERDDLHLPYSSPERRINLLPAGYTPARPTFDKHSRREHHNSRRDDLPRDFIPPRSPRHDIRNTFLLYGILATDVSPTMIRGDRRREDSAPNSTRAKFSVDRLATASQPDDIFAGKCET